MKYRSEILQRKILYQVSIDNEFLKIHLLIELKIVSMRAPLQRRAFATLIASNSRSEKYSENTQVSKKETDNWHSAGRLRNRKELETGSALQNGCCANFQKISRETSMVTYSF